MNGETMKDSPGRRTLHYHSFILTMWREDGEPAAAPPLWRCSLENPHTGERIGFRSANDLGRFLIQWAALLPSDRAEGEG
jgi:hypothetical protein